jgi:hypothetical protein
MSYTGNKLRKIVEERFGERCIRKVAITSATFIFELTNGLRIRYNPYLGPKWDVSRIVTLEGSGLTIESAVAVYNENLAELHEEGCFQPVEISPVIEELEDAED